MLAANYQELVDHSARAGIELHRAQTNPYENRSQIPLLEERFSQANCSAEIARLALSELYAEVDIIVNNG